MKATYLYLFPAIWICYIIYWWIMATNIKSSIQVEPATSRIVRAITIITAFGLLYVPTFPITFLNTRFLPSGYLFLCIGIAITTGGLAFSIRARKLLGKNWSQAVTIKHDHQLVTNGPYAFVRHPIYTGFTLGFVGSSIALGELRGLIATILVLGVLLYKSRLEDQWLLKQFGNSYAEYYRKVSALIPHIL